MSDEWPDEPEEDDPESRWGDPERDLPTVPEVATPDPGAADPELTRLFWASVVAANIALFGLALGPMLVFFRGDWTLGAASVAVGAFALFRTYTYYRRVGARRDDGDDAGTDDGTEPTGDDGTDSTDAETGHG